MRRVLEIFRLTSAEQRVVVFVVLTLLAIAIAQKHRETTAPTSLKQSPATSTTPGALDQD
jgi:uncharacterized membrane protein